MLTHEIDCPYCDGKGYTVRPIHVCGGNIEFCQQRCPEAERRECFTCGGSGIIEIEPPEDQRLRATGAPMLPGLE